MYVTWFIFLLGSLLGLPLKQEPAPAKQELPPIRNFFRIDKDYCSGGQPRPEHFAQLKAEGVKVVINLRPASEHRVELEETAVKENGLRYINIPVVFGDPKDEQVDEFLKVLDDPNNRPAFIHCAGAIRVGAFWLIRRVLRDGWTVEKAEAEAEKIGLKNAPHLNQFARGYIERHKSK